jgi:hypothetical protein
MKTLREQLIRLKAEELLKKLGAPVSLLDLEEEESKRLPGEGELREKAQKVVDEAEQFFARFGLTEEKQEFLFQMPMLEGHWDEIATNVFLEREELERTIGRPREGWDPLPFERDGLMEKFLQNLPQEIGTEKVEEIHLDEIFDTSAREQILAVQRRLSEALENVKKASCEQKKTLTLPSLPKRESSVQATPIELADLSEKRQIEMHTEHHYADALKVIVAGEDPLKKAIADGKLLQDPDLTRKNQIIEESDFMESSELLIKNELLSGAKNEVRSAEAIVADIEKMAQKSKKIEDSPAVIIPEVVEPDEKNNISATTKKSAVARPRHGIVISALRSQMQREQNPQTSIVTESLAQDADSKKTSENKNPFLGHSLPQLPSLATLNFNNSEEGDGSGKIIAARRRQMVPRRFYL